MGFGGLQVVPAFDFETLANTPLGSSRVEHRKSVRSMPKFSKVSRPRATRLARFVELGIGGV